MPIQQSRILKTDAASNQNSGITGTIENIVYSNVNLSGMSNYGIDYQQNYLRGGPTGSPTIGVEIFNVQFENITGIATSDDVNHYVLSGSGSCTDISFAGVNVTGGGKTSSCNFATTGCPA